MKFKGITPETEMALFHNEVDINVTITRLKTTKQHINALIKRDLIRHSEGFFKYNAQGFNSYGFNENCDVIFVDWSGKIIELYPSFRPNTLTKHIPNAKFLYILAEGVIKINGIEKDDEIHHERKRS